MVMLPAIAVNLNIQADSEIGALRALVRLAETTERVIDRVRLAEDAAETTFYHLPGKHLCAALFPVFTKGVSSPVVAFGRVSKDIGYRCTRDDPVDLIALAAAPLEQTEDYSPCFSRLRVFLAEETNRKRLRALERAEDVKRELMNLMSGDNNIQPAFADQRRERVETREDK